MNDNILFLDIETAPETAYIWKRWKETVGQGQVVAGGYVLCVAWAFGDGKVMSKSIFNGDDWRAGDKRNDRSVVQLCHELMGKADIVVGHNVRSFDVATLNARMVTHGIMPPATYKIVDTLDVLKRRMRLPSNSLETASHLFGIATKEKQHFDLWAGCLDGKPESWRKMLAYCRHDVDVVRQLYVKLLPWIDNHPNMALYKEGGDLCCPKCGSTNVQKRGVQVTMVHRYTRYQCQDCGGWLRDRLSDKDFGRDHVAQHTFQ